MKKILLIILCLICLTGCGSSHKTNIVLCDSLDFEINSDMYLMSIIKKISNGELITENYKIDTSELGTQEIIIKYLNENQKEKEYKFNINIVDTQAPIIEYNKELSTTAGVKIDLLKDVKVIDNSNEAINATVEGDYDNSKTGTYNLKYVAIDSSGNKIEEDFILKVNSATIKNTGYYVYKKSEAWYGFAFNKDKSVVYDIWDCPGTACGGDTRYGTYSIDGDKINVEITHYLTEGYDDMIEVPFDNPIKYEFTIINENKIQYKNGNYNWQKNFA